MTTTGSRGNKKIIKSKLDPDILTKQKVYVNTTAADEVKTESPIKPGGSDDNDDEKMTTLLLDKPNSGNVGLDNVIQLFKSAAGIGNEWYSYGVTEANEYHKIIKNKQILYKNGETGIYNEFAIYPAGNKGGGNNTKVYDFSYKPTPDFLYDENTGIRNHEFTAYIKFGEPVTSSGFRSIRVKLGGRDEPDKRSSYEVWIPTIIYSDPIFNFDYTIKQERQVLTNVRLFRPVAPVLPDQWVGIKVVNVVSEDKSHNWVALYIDEEPFIDDNIQQRPRNKFELVADCIMNTANSPNNGIVPIWKSFKDSIIVEGYKDVEWLYVSDREIDPEGVKPLHMEHLTVNEYSTTFRTAMKPQWNMTDFEEKEVWEEYNI